MIARAFGRIGWKVLTACGATVFCIAAARAQGLVVTAITIDGQAERSMSGALVRTSGASSQSQSLQIGQTIGAGTEITLPRGARVELTSANGNRITVHPGARFAAGLVTPRGELHQPLGGRIEFQVRKALDFFNVQYDRITASVKGTEYTIEIEPGTTLTLAVSEGIIEVEREVEVRIATVEDPDADETEGETIGSSSTIRISETIKAGQTKIYQLNVSQYLAEFTSFREAEAYFLKALAEAERGGDSAQIYRAVTNSMDLYRALGNGAALLKFEDKCLELARALTDPGRDALCWRHTGVGHRQLGDYRKALEHHQKSLVLTQSLYLGHEHLDLASSYSTLGTTYSRLREFRKSIEHHAIALAMRVRLYGRDAPSIALTMYNLGRAHAGLREYGPALEYHEKALAMRQRLYQTRDHPDIARSFGYIGTTYYALGEHRKAIAYYENALAMFGQVHAGRDNPYSATVLYHMGVAFEALGDYRKAIEYQRQALTMRENVYSGRDHVAIVRSLRRLASVYAKSGGGPDAKIYRERAASMQRRLNAIK